MKKGWKRIISLILCAAMLASSGALAAVASAADGECNCDYSPVIILPGINHSPTYLYDENNEPVLDSDGKQIGGTLLILETRNIIKIVPKLLFSIFATILTQHNVGLDKAAYEAASYLFSIQKCDDNGNHVENLQTKRWNHPISEMTEDDIQWLYRMVPIQALENEIGGDHIYMFTFNLVGDPMESADELHEYIKMVKEQTGHDKVSFLPVSLGGTILTAYLDKYGHEDLDQIVNAVACLNGTDIVADMYARKWNLSDEYLYHEYIARIMEEENDDPTLGYIINIVLHILPRSGVNALLSGAISAILDTIMINCPQMWAMVPSYRYEALANKYLSSPEKAELRAKTDRFQQARLNLNDNILAAVADGVKVNSISGSNLAFGEQMYSFFNIVDSANKVNTDGIINMSSTTMGATGAPAGQTLPEGYKQAYTNPDYPDYSYISPDNKIDASTAVLPDNTWIFLNQHHEVGNNDVVLNLAKALFVGEVSNVHDNPEKYPQFNYTCNTKGIRRWRLPDAKDELEKNANLSAEDKAELTAAIAEGEAVLALTIADAERVDAADQRLKDILVKVGRYQPEEEPSKLAPYVEKAAENFSLFLLKTLGGGSLFDKIFR